ncbi:hypothetical protein ID007_004307 [Salmonella enterica]|nr:hypothetical protein [Salmonella enterica]
MKETDDLIPLYCFVAICRNMRAALDFDDPDVDRRIRAAISDVLKYFDCPTHTDKALAVTIAELDKGIAIQLQPQPQRPQIAALLFIADCCVKRFHTTYAEDYELRDAERLNPHLTLSPLMELQLKEGDRRIEIDWMKGLFAANEIAIRKKPSAGEALIASIIYDLVGVFGEFLPDDDPRKAYAAEQWAKAAPLRKQALGPALYHKCHTETVAIMTRLMRNKQREDERRQRAAEMVEIAKANAAAEKAREQQRLARAEKRARLLAEREAERQRQEADAAIRLAEIQRQREAAAAAPRELTEEERLLQIRREITRVFTGFPAK